jgi:small subunit ribosomal protein S4
MEKNVCKICRREGVKLFLKGERCFSPKCSFTRRSYAPGAHGQKRRVRPSDYYIQLSEKQKARFTYGISENQFKRYYQMLTKSKNKSAERGLLSILETRLDNVIYRLGFASSRKQAKQLIVHGIINVDGKKIDAPSYLVGAGQTVNTSKKDLELTKTQVPSWLKLDKKKKEAKVLSIPIKDQLPGEIDEGLIVEYYSR